MYASRVLMVWRGVERVAERDIIAICVAGWPASREFYNPWPKFGVP